MSSAEPRLFGKFANHPKAPELAREVHRTVFAYAHEVVSAFRLCPFLHNVETGMGAVGVVLDVEPDVETGIAAIRDLGANVVHLVYPLVGPEAPPFERFANRLSEGVRRTLKEPLVHATFHPSLSGATDTAHRLVGLLRQAPDAFVQFIPPGLQQGGTILAGAGIPTEGHAEERFRRLRVGGLDELLKKLEAFRSERLERYADLAREISQAG